MLSPDLFRNIKQLSEYENFDRIAQLTENAKQQQRHIEWAMRVLVHAYVDFDNKRDVENFIDDGLTVLAKLPDDELRQKFCATFDLLFRAAGADALKPQNNEGRLANRVTLRQIEAIAVGVARNVDAISQLEQPIQFLSGRLQNFWIQRQEVEQMSAQGLRGTQRLQRTVPFGAKWFAPEQDG